MEKMTMNAEKIIAFNQSNVEVIMKSGQIWAAGVQDISRTFAATTQAQLDSAMTAWKALGSVRSLKEAVELQTGLARTSFQTAVAETGSLTDASVRLAEQAIAPVAARMTAAVEMMMHPHA
jgi:phasin family protein